MLLNPFIYHAPKTINSAAKLYARLPQAKIVAGGTFAINMLKTLKRNSSKTPKHVISLKKIKTLKGISKKKGVISIGAMTTISEILESEILRQSCPVLVKVAQHMATTQIRNMATIGGNITARFVWTEFQAPLIALEADLHFLNKNAKATIMKAENFFQQKAKTNTLLTQVSFPVPSVASLAYRRVPKRCEPDLPMFSLCIKASLKDQKLQNPKVIINDSCDFAKRNLQIEKFLSDLDLSTESLEKSLGSLDRFNLTKKEDSYKKTIMLLTLKEAIVELINSNDDNSSY